MPLIRSSDAAASIARNACNSGNCRVRCSDMRFSPASGSDEGESVMISEKSILRIDSGLTATLFSIDPAMPINTKIQMKKTRNVPTTKARSPARKVLMKFIVASYYADTNFSLRQI